MTVQRSQVTASFMERITARQEELGLSDEEVDKQVGATSGFSLAAIKKSSRQLGLDDIPKLAIALEFDPGDLLRHALRERAPEHLQLLDQYMHPSGLTAREANVLAQYRSLVRDEESGPIVYEVTTHRAMIIDSVRRVHRAAQEKTVPPKDTDTSQV